MPLGSNRDGFTPVSGGGTIYLSTQMPTTKSTSNVKTEMLKPVMEKSITSGLRCMEDQLDSIHGLVLHIYRMFYAKE